MSITGSRLAGSRSRASQGGAVGRLGGGLGSGRCLRVEAARDGIGGRFSGSRSARCRGDCADRSDGSNGRGARGVGIGCRASGCDGCLIDRRDRGVSPVELLLSGQLGSSKDLIKRDQFDQILVKKGDLAYLKDAGKLVLGKLDTVADSLSDGSKDLFNLVLRLDVVN